ncbi:hypothetical protein EMIHUDRAFT_207494 [Emiliania huxleyi CCMP1516]|uniref:Glucosidase II beta subunit N-terminal domain-containing protein n=2 Tax=Emiliania huxleyi TaxID=2903 RepID=A0A0D3JFM2_EMIH1|nr:hypothetical protein EMIHUDRAFT_207494 [Emiliania huxleyi CCMP1516]EOD22307.1 hypothetical protein EMIHUDRAFT_207494 [Emiliania huxleyi CCMP1516]|eukprot:XP_005774736.1 hypothetical protein EMIHUDRAFT_207494 [Emiliania huxleyi CCMP1516]
MVCGGRAARSTGPSAAQGASMPMRAAWLAAIACSEGKRIFLLRRHLSTAMFLSLVWPASAAEALRGVSAEALRGVSADARPSFNGPTFRCRDGGAEMPSARVNDDYCDCLDGSDEPGTSACALGAFYCANVGFKPRVLPASRVDDGICDCCDGSDESAERRAAEEAALNATRALLERCTAEVSPDPEALAACPPPTEAEPAAEEENSDTALCTHCETCGPPAPECGPTAGKWGCYGVLGAAPAAEAEAPSLRALAHTDSHSAHARSLANNSLLTSRTGACPLPPLA